MKKHIVMVTFAVTVIISMVDASMGFCAESNIPDLSGKWSIQQKNSGSALYRGVWSISQRGSELSGTAEWENHMNGRIDGTVVGNNMNLTISYTDGLKGWGFPSGCGQTVKGTSTANRGNDEASWNADRYPTMDGRWAIQQANSGGARFNGIWIMSQQGNEVSGTAQWENHMQGRINGKLVGSNLDLTISYDDGLKGFYKGVYTAGCIPSVKGSSTANRGKDSANWSGEVQR